MTLGEIIAQALGAANAGAEHRYATATRGGDYLQKEEVLGNQERQQALSQGLSLKEQMLKDAITKAAAMSARQGETSTIMSDVGTPDQVQSEPTPLEVPEGASDMEAAALGEQNTKSAKEAGDLLLQKGRIREQNAIAGRNEGYLEDRAEGRKSAEKIAGTRAGAARDVQGMKSASAERIAKARAEAAKLGITWVAGVDEQGNAGKVAVPKNSAPGTFVGGPGTAMEQNRESMSAIALKAGHDVANLLDDPNFSEVIGPAAGRYESWNAAFLSGDPQFLDLQTRLRALAQVLTGIHNLRSARAGESLEKLLSTTNSVETLKGALEGALSIAQDFVDQKSERGRTNSPKAAGAPAGNVIKVDANGDPIG